MSSPRPDLVVAVDSRGEPVGAAEKLAAHEPPGVLHLAFSVFVFDPEGRLLLQQRAGTKYHFAGRWSNSCCGHPHLGEPVLAAAARRLSEEMGITVALREVGEFRYRAADPVSGLVENELDHVFVGPFEGDPRPDPTEVADWRWIGPTELRTAIAASPEEFTPWLEEALAFAMSAADG